MVKDNMTKKDTLGREISVNQGGRRGGKKMSRSPFFLFLSFFLSFFILFFIFYIVVDFVIH